MVAPSNSPDWADELESKSSEPLQSGASFGGAFFFVPFVVEDCPVCVLEPKPGLELKPELEPKPVPEPNPEGEPFVWADDPNAEELVFAWDEPNPDVLALVWPCEPGGEEVPPGCDVGETV